MNPSPLVRPFKNEDLEPVVSLWAETVANPSPWNEPRGVILRKLREADGLMLVAERDQQIVGTVLAGYDGVRGWLYRVAVLPECQRQGIGRLLVREAETRLARRGCRKINLQVRETNRGVIAFYKRCGFSVDGVASLGKPLSEDGSGGAEPVATIPVDDEIRLTPPRSADAPALVRLLNETEDFSRHLGRMPYPYTPFDAEQWLGSAAVESAKTDETRSWMIRSGDELVGVIGLRHFKRGDTAEVGYWLARGYWGRGVMTSVLKALCRFAFEHEELRRIYAGAFTENPGSCRVLEKAGFRREGMQREHIFRNGRGLDVNNYGLLRGEFRP